MPQAAHAGWKQESQRTWAKRRPNKGDGRACSMQARPMHPDLLGEEPDLDAPLPQRRLHLLQLGQAGWRQGRESVWGRRVGRGGERHVQRRQGLWRPPCSWACLLAWLPCQLALCWQPRPPGGHAVHASIEVVWRGLRREVAARVALLLCAGRRAGGCGQQHGGTRGTF